VRVLGALWRMKDLRRMPPWEAMLLAVTAAALAGWFFGRLTGAASTGFIVVAAEPPDATKACERAPVMIERSPGRYAVSIMRHGYMRKDQTVEVVEGRAIRLKVELEASSDTGFELTSEPPGLPVWLDGLPLNGLPLNGAPGRPQRTPLRVDRIKPGHHRIELRADGFKNWMMDVPIEAGALRKVSAVMVPGR
jgi:hypothetical protein